MTREFERVQLDNEPDLVRIIEQVHGDHTPRLIRRGDESLAVIISLDDYVGSSAAETRPTSTAKRGVGFTDSTSHQVMALVRVRSAMLPSISVPMAVGGSGGTR
jgi:hypothetical protein